MTWSLTELGGDILLFERLLDSALCSHILEIAECCQFQPAGIELSENWVETPSLQDGFILFCAILNVVVDPSVTPDRQPNESKARYRWGSDGTASGQNREQLQGNGKHPEYAKKNK